MLIEKAGQQKQAKYKIIKYTYNTMSDKKFEICKIMCNLHFSLFLI